MIFISNGVAYGPFQSIEPLDDRLLCDGVDYPFSVIGNVDVVAHNESDHLVVVPDPVIEVPQVVTRRQARQALLLAGLLDLVPQKIADITDPTYRAMAQIEWEDSLEFMRNRPLVIQIGAALGLDAAGLDQLFITAGGL